MAWMSNFILQETMFGCNHLCPNPSWYFFSGFRCLNASLGIAVYKVSSDFALVIKIWLYSEYIFREMYCDWLCYNTVQTIIMITKKNKTRKKQNKTKKQKKMMTSSNGYIFRVTGPLCGELTGHPWIPRTKASDVELWSFLWYSPE